MLYLTFVFYVASLVVKNLPAMQETRVRSLDWEDPLEKGMATHSSMLAWRIPWTEEPGGLQSTEDHKESDTTGQLTVSYVTRGQGRSRSLTPGLPPGMLGLLALPFLSGLHRCFLPKLIPRGGPRGLRRVCVLRAEINLSVTLDRVGLEGF